MSTEPRYRVRVELPRLVCGPAYVRVRPDWCGSWYTRKPADAKLWKTARGAHRWLDEHPGVTGGVESV